MHSKLIGSKKKIFFKLAKFEKKKVYPLLQKVVKRDDRMEKLLHGDFPLG
jgi:hypothetical protein